eukprot:16245430-Heterocapsa_arctica.AAC.1
MYKTPRIVQDHKSNTQAIEANRGIIAGCAFAVHYFKSMIKQDVKDVTNELIYYVDDMVLNDKKEHIFVQSKIREIIWHQNCPDYKGRVGQA